MQTYQYRSCGHFHEGPPLSYGAVGYGLGSALGKAVSWQWPPNLQTNNAQRAIIGGMQAGVQAVSNPALLDAAEKTAIEFINGR